MLRVLVLGLAMTAPAYAGPQCTVEYPRGFTVPKGTAKRPLAICHGDMEETWGKCVKRWRA
jgi:hypothetical protein